MLLPGTVLALSPGLRRGRVCTRHWPWGCCRSSDSSTRARGCRWSCGRRCSYPGGLPSNPPGWSAARREPFLRLVRRTSPLLVGAVLAIMLLTVGGRAWSEYRAAATLPPPPADARNVLLIVWDTVRAE